LCRRERRKKSQTSPGGYHGEQDFPISWKRYYSYAEWTKIMHDLQKQYPQLADIGSIGKSRMGRDQYLLTITAKATGKPEEKTGLKKYSVMQFLLPPVKRPGWNIDQSDIVPFQGLTFN
jgi:hypothetical protein